MQKEINDLREEAQRLQDKRTAARADPTKPAFTPEDERRAAEVRVQLATRGNRRISPVLAETVTLEVTLAAGTAAGKRELRLRPPIGLSNPMVFAVGQLPEFREPVQIAIAGPAPPRPNREPDARNARS